MSASQIDLAWTDNADNENGFKIERSLNGSDGWSLIDTVFPDTETYSDTGLAAQTTYYYRVLAFNNYSDSDPSDIAFATTTSGSSMHIGDLDDGSILTKVSRWNAVVTITVHDVDHNPIVGASVSGLWSDGATGSGSGITDDLGKCSITKSNLKSNVSSVTFTVEDVALAGYTYVLLDNHDPDGDSNGTVMTLVMP
jgi:hypothetical protein